MKRFDKLILTSASIFMLLANSSAFAATKIGKTVSSETQVTANGGRVLKQNTALFRNDQLLSNGTGLGAVGV